MLPPKVFPAEMPSFIRQDPLRESECTVYDLLKAQLDAKFTVYYSRYWFGLGADGSELDGEADFIVVHETFGILAIEVKGGGISYDPVTSRWESTNRWRIRRTIKDPFYQARTCKHRLLEELRANKSTSNCFVRARHAVVFPDSEPSAERLGWDKPLELVCFSNRLNELGNFVRARMGVTQSLSGNEQPLGPVGVGFFDNLLAKKFTLDLRLGRVLNQDESAFVTLSDQQFQIMEGIAQQERWAIAGPAGSGKTILAIEQARRAATSGNGPVLICCLNAPLVAFIKDRLKGCAPVEVKTFHTILAEAGLNRHSSAPEIASSLADYKPKFKTIIVDEGQDFLPGWWPGIEHLVDDEGQLFVFYDDRQKLGEIPSNFIKGMPRCPFVLSRNVRNTKQIFKLANHWMAGPTPVSSWGPDGPEVVWYECRRERLRDQVCQTLKTLTEVEKIHPRQIAVLCATPAGVSLLRNGNKVCSTFAHDAEHVGDAGITVDTVRRFKGLESQAVILVLDEQTIPADELLYVALTRGRSYLAICGEKAVLDALKSAVGNKEYLAAMVGKGLAL